MVSHIFLGWDRALLLGREDMIIEGLATIDSRTKYFTINFGDRIGPEYSKEQLFVELFCNNNKNA